MKTHVECNFNKPSLYINGELTPPVIYALSDFPGARSNTYQAYRNIKNFGNAGVHLVEVDTELRLGWHKLDAFDTEPMREEIGYALDANPNAKIVVRLHLNPPYWWLKDHPEECVVYRTPEGDIFGADNGEQERLIANDNLYHLRASIGSDLWKEEAGKLLKELMESLKGTREGNSIAAIQVAGGMFGEWHHWSEGHAADVSLPMQNHFKAFLKEKYTTEENLRKAWHMPDVTFENAEYSPEQFGKWDDGAFRNPETSQPTIDAQMSNQLVVAKAILYFGNIVKETLPDILCGSFYGYYFNTQSERRTLSGHLYPHMMFEKDSPIDFLCGPFPYYKECRHPDGIPMQRALLESMRLNGKLWITEMDAHPAGTEKIPGGDPDALAETKAILWRNCLQPLLGGEGFWYYDHRLVPLVIPPDSQNSAAASIYRKSGWWEKPELMSEIQKIQNFAEKLSAKEYTKSADVLLVYDTESFYYRGIIDEYKEEYLNIKALTAYGAVYDCIYAKDIDKCDISAYKCIIFVNSRKVSDDERKKYRKLSENAMIIHLGGHGYCNGLTLAEKNISDSVGINLKKTTANQFVCGDFEAEITNDMLPCFEVCDNDATPLAYYDNGEIAAGIKNNDVYVHLPYIPENLAGLLLKKAGVHSWCDSGEPIIAGSGYMAIYCNKPGKRTVFLPGGKKYIVETTDYKTVIFDLENGELL